MSDNQTGGSVAVPTDIGYPSQEPLFTGVATIGRLGQQRRVALALLLARQPELLLDEPTKHVSLALAVELEEALQRSVGTVIVASHDRWWRHRWDAHLEL